MWIVDRIIAIFDPLMRSTLELRDLNKLWEAFNEEKNGEATRRALLARGWKYHLDRAHLLLDFTFLV